MERTYDHAGLAAVTLLRIAADESDSASILTGRMHHLITELSQHSGPDAPAELAIILARRYFHLLDSVAEALNVTPRKFLDLAELDELSQLKNGEEPHRVTGSAGR